MPGDEHASTMTGGAILGVYPQAESLRPTLVGERWAVSAGHPLVAEVAAEVFRRGGNAVDAGVAAGLASNVVQVDMANFGGIAPILIRPAGTDHVVAISGVGAWSRLATRNAVAERCGAYVQEGFPAALVPGAPGAWILALAEFGTWTFADIAAPAIELARDGFPLDLRTAKSLEIMGRTFSAWPESARIYWPAGRPPHPGERLRQPDLARLLEQLAAAEHGSTRRAALDAIHAAFYLGEPGRRIVHAVREGGGFLTLDDLANHHPAVEEVPRLEVGDWRYHATPTCTQAPIVLEALGILRHTDIHTEPHNGGRYLHLLAEALKLAFADRELHYGDPNFVDVGLEMLLEPARLARLAASITEHASASRLLWAPHAPVKSTTAVVTCDASGTAFAATPSDTLDGAPIISDLGIICSPRGVQSRLDPRHANVVAPGKRPCVTPSAIVALPAQGEAGVWAMSCPGGDVIVQAITQATLNCTLAGMTLQQAVEAPRIAIFDYPGAFAPHPAPERLVMAEARIDADATAGLERRGHTVDAWPRYEFDAGSVQTVRLRGGQDGSVIEAAADPRRSAYAIAR